MTEENPSGSEAYRPVAILSNLSIADRLLALAQRRTYQPEPIDNSALYAGSPM